MSNQKLRDLERITYGRPLRWYERIEPIGWIFIGMLLTNLGVIVLVAIG